VKFPRERESIHVFYAVIMSRKELAAPLDGSPESTQEVMSSGKKRKAEDVPEDEKLAIDVNLPEPPSKKAKRAEKKKTKEKRVDAAEVSDVAKALVKEYSGGDAAQATGSAGSGAQKRSEYGIWIGNLPFTATKETLRQFLADQGGIDAESITRLHMPTPNDKSDSKLKPQNKGFAYVDFPSQAIQDIAVGLSEKLMTGRRVLIKNAKSFEGRPRKAVDDTTAAKDGKSEKEPARRVFVGNLSFDVTQEDLTEHFSLAGDIEDIHMATFEDSGKCKGFAWVRFKEVEGAEAAVRGFVYRKADDEDESDDDDADIVIDAADAGSKKKRKAKPRRHKQHINQLHGRELRREFAEDAQTRYKKRYGKDSKSGTQARGNTAEAPRGAVSGATDGNDKFEDLVQQAAAARDFKGPKPRAQKRDADQRRDERRKKHEDARNIAPGKALADAQRSTGAIVAGAGKRMTFE